MVRDARQLLLSGGGARVARLEVKRPGRSAAVAAAVDDADFSGVSHIGTGAVDAAPTPGL